MKVELITIGTEILMGDILNTNAQFLSRQCLQLGLGVFYQTTIGDNYERIYNAFQLASQRSDLIIITGGLGPTEDDLTKEVFADFLGETLEVCDIQHEKNIQYFENKGREMAPNNIRQAYTISNGTTLINQVGLACGLIYTSERTQGRTDYVVLPGPPAELEAMFLNQVVPFIKNEILKSESMVIQSRYYHLYDIGESTIAKQIETLITAQTNPTIALYAKNNMVTIRVTANACNDKECDIILSRMEQRLQETLYSPWIGEGEDFTIEQYIIHRCQSLGYTLSAAESLTGGLVQAKLTSIPGASQVVRGGYVTYQTPMKTQLLGVPEQTIQQYSVVSHEVARSMAERLRERTHSTIAISLTGVAGPDGLADQLPGTVYIGIAFKDQPVISEVYHFPAPNRNAVRNRSVNEVMRLLYHLIKNKNKCSYFLDYHV